MAWLRLDDKFTSSRKFAGWTPGQKWAWLQVMEYCAAQGTHGCIPDDLDLMPRSTTAALLRRAEESGFIDRSDDGGMVIHDWPIYNGATVAEKVSYYLAKHPDASANEVHKAVGGTRELVLAEVAKHRATGTKPGSDEPTQGGLCEPPDEPPRVEGLGGSEPGSETGTHGREPVPSPKSQEPRALPEVSFGVTPSGSQPADVAAGNGKAPGFQTIRTHLERIDSLPPLDDILRDIA